MPNGWPSAIITLLDVASCAHKTGESAASPGCVSIARIDACRQTPSSRRKPCTAVRARAIFSSDQIAGSAGAFRIASSAARLLAQRCIRSASSIWAEADWAKASARTAASGRTARRRVMAAFPARGAKHSMMPGPAGVRDGRGGNGSTADGRKRPNPYPNDGPKFTAFPPFRAQVPTESSGAA